MKNILIVTGNRIFPALTGGQVHTLSIARALARMGNTVRIFSLTGRKEDYTLANVARGRLIEADIEARLSEIIELGAGLGIVQAVGRRLGFPRIWQHHLLARGLVPESLKVALQAADIVLCDLPYCPPIPGPWRSKPWYLISHNLEHKLLEQGAARYRRYAAWMREVETSASQIYSDILACADDDQAFFRANDVQRHLAVPMIRCGVDPAAYAFPEGLRERTRAQLGFTDEDRILVFSGSGYQPNIVALDSIKAFCRREAEFLASRRVKFLIVGSVSPVACREGALVATGRVESILPFFAAGDAGINMVQTGSGSNVKLFEYLAARLPVISTPFGVRGTELVAGVDFLACTVDTLKDCIMHFLETDMATWRARAEGVWMRHRRTSDIQNLVEDAVAQLPAFVRAA